MKTVHIVPHTHWDFEWYFTNNESFVQLVYQFNDMIDAFTQKKLKTYLLDGQMSLIDDYLKVFPNKEQLLTELVTKNQLILGPWYTQSDELIIAGESLLRNLALGTQLADRLGGYMKIGYLPDSFGQSKDMPKIYQQFAITRAIFWRGVAPHQSLKREFRWQSEDGSEVDVVVLRNGYYIAADFWQAKTPAKLISAIEVGATENQLLAPLGADQRFVDTDLPEKIAAYNQSLNGENYQVIESTYEDYMDSLSFANKELLSGEFLSASVSKIHRSIYSSRYDHKRYNDVLESRLIFQLEPMMALADLMGIPVQRELVTTMWQLLCKNHAHDGAGGCNSDKTNLIINERFKEVDQLSYSTLDYLKRKIAETRINSQNNELLVFNLATKAVKRNSSVTISTKSAFFEVYLDNQKIDYALVSSKKENAGSIKRNVSEMDPADFYYIHEIIISEVLPAFSYTVFNIKELAHASDTRTLTEPTPGQIISNDAFKVEFKAGQLNLVNKQNHQSYRNFITIEEAGDEGDTYDYSPPYEDWQLNLDFTNAIATIKKNIFEERLLLKGSWQLPRDLNSREKRLLNQKQAYSLEIILRKQEKRIDFDLKIMNEVKDHRMRVVFKPDFLSDCSTADTPFGTIQRPVVDENLANWREQGLKEEPTGIYPLIHFCQLANGKEGWSVLAKGIKEYEIINQETSQIALTLFRSVGFLGRPDLLRRPGIASGNQFKYIETPDSQLMQPLSFEFSLVISEDLATVNIFDEYQRYGTVDTFFQNQELNRFTAPLRYFKTNPQKNKLEFSGFLEVMNENLVVSSLKKSDFYDGIEVRVFNPSLTESILSEKIQTQQVQSFFEVDLLGNKLKAKVVGQEYLLTNVKPGEIRTILIM